MSTAIVIGCGAAKLDRPAPARDLYTGSLFRAARKAAESTGLPWFILSAKHGLVAPHTVLEPYDVTLRAANDTARALTAVQATAHQLPRVNVYIVDGRVGVEGVAAWCSAPYRGLLVAAGVHVDSAPLEGLSMGRQIQWFTRTARGEAA